MCGLKLYRNGFENAYIGHTLRGCVDWNIRKDGSSRVYGVTPYVGVWIETLNSAHILIAFASHPTWVCGLKQSSPYLLQQLTVTPYVGVWIETSVNFKVKRSFCHTLRGCVDWNRHIQQNLTFLIVTPYVGVWIETISLAISLPNSSSHPTWVCGLKRFLILFRNPGICVTPYVGVWIETPRKSY